MHRYSYLQSCERTVQRRELLATTETGGRARGEDDRGDLPRHAHSIARGSDIGLRVLRGQIRIGRPS
jgi:hypothetical protein